MAQQNANRNQGSGQSPKTSINVTPTSQDFGDRVQITFEVAVFNGNNPVTAQSIVLMDGVSRIAQATGAGTTGTNGIGMLQVEVPLTDKEQQKMFRVSLDGRPETFSFPVLIPAKKKVAEAKNSAESLIAMKYQNDNGDVRFKLRLLKNNGEGIENQIIAAWFRGRDVQVTTNAIGEALFPEPGIRNRISLCEGDEEDIVFTTSGIKKEAKMKLIRRIVLNQARAFSSGWWFGTNNGRAFVLLLLVILMWFVALKYGPGNPVAGESLFNGKDGFSASERYYNETATRYGRAIAPTSTENNFIFFGLIAKKKIWIWALILTFAFIIYFPIAAREEIAEAIEDIKVKLIDRSIVKVDDPFFEKLVASANSIGFARDPSSNEVQFGPVSSSTAAHPEDLNRDGKKDKGGFGSSFLSFLSLDLLGDLLVGITKRIFARN